MADDQQTNVTLTANVTPYERSIDQAAASTNKLIGTIATLTTAIDGAFKAAGKTMQIGGAGMVASITAAGFAAGRLEQQMSQLNASTDMASKSQVQYQQRMDMYAKSVTNLRSTFGMTSAAAIDLVSQLNKMGQSTQNVQELTRSFTQLAAVSGEGVNGLVTGMISLQRAMGTEGIQATKAMNASLATLSQTAGVSAEGVLQFSNSLAPVAKLAGVSQREIMGISTAFVKSGQDGYAAANAFNKMLTDITRSIQYGSPEIANYANLIGVSVDSFKQMPKAEAVTQIFEAINAQGPQALKTLERMGLDGVRSLKAIQGVAQSGGIRNAIYDAMGTGNEDKLAGASDKAFSGLNDQLAKLAENGKMIAEAFGSGVLPVMTKLAAAVNGVLSPIRAVLQALGSLPGGAAALAGVGLMAAGTVTRAFTGLSTLGVATGAYRTLRGGYRYGRSADLSDREFNQAASYEERRDGRPAPGNWVQHGLFGVANRVGEMRGPITAMDGTTRERGPLNPLRVMQRGAIGGIQFMGGLMGAGLDPLGTDAWRNNMNRDKRYQAFTEAKAADSFGWGAAKNQYNRVRGMMGSEEHAAAAAAAARLDSSMNSAANSTAKYSSATGALLGETRTLASAMAEASLTTMKMGAIGSARVLSVGGGGLMKGLGGMASSALGMVGGGMGASLMGGMYVWDKYQQGLQNNAALLADKTNVGPGGVYAAALGEAATATRSFADVVKEQASIAKASGFQAKPTADEINTANTSRSDFTLKPLSDSNKAETTALAQSFYASNPSATQQQAFRLDLMRKYGTDQSGMAHVNEIMAAGRSGRVDMTALYEGASNAASQFTGIGDFFGGGNDNSRNRSAVAGSAIQQMISGAGASGNYKVQSQAGLTALNQLSAAVRNTGASSGGQGGLNPPDPLGDNAVNAMAVSYVKGIMGDAGKQSDIDAVKKAINESGGDTNRMRQMIAQSGTKIGDLVERQTRDVQSLGANVNSLEMPSTTWYRSGFQSAGVESSVLEKLRGTPGIQGSGASPVVRSIFDNPTNTTGRAVINAISNEGNQNMQFESATRLSETTIKLTGNFADAAAALDEIKAAAGSSSSALYQQAEAARGLVRQRQQEAMPYMTRAQQVEQYAANFRADQQTNLNNPSEQSASNAEQSRQALEAQRASVYGTLKQFALQVREFNVSRQRGEDDFARQQQYNLDDYNRSRQYAEDDFTRQRAYAQEDYDRSRARNLEDFNRSRDRQEQDFALSRVRQEQDFNHQVVVMARETAKSMTNIYERMNVQRTWSAQNLLQNMADQQGKLDAQQAQLARLRRAGLSNQAISQMRLNDPSMMQQLARLADDMMGNRTLIAQFNDAARKRAASGTALVKDPANDQFSEMRRSFTLNMNRAREDFTRAMSRSQTDFNRMMDRGREDFQRGMNRQEKQFEISMDRQAEQFDIQTNRMTDNFNRSMRRAGEDLNRGMEEITGSFQDLADAALSTLTGTANAQMTELLGALGYTKGQVVSMTQSTVKAVNDLFEGLGISSGGTMKSPGGGTAMTGTVIINGKKFNRGQFAAGGEIPGFSPSKTADNVPIMATAGEYMQPVDSVNYYGKGFMDAVRERRIPRGMVQGLASGGMVYQQMESWMKSHLPGVAITSDYRDPATNARVGGSPTSLHMQGKAVDMAPSMGTFNTILNAFGSKILELFYAPANGRTILHGKPWTMPPALAADHYDHIHWAMNSMAGLAGASGNPSNGWNGTAASLFNLVKAIPGIKRFNTLMNQNRITGMQQLGHDRLAEMVTLRGMMMNNPAAGIIASLGASTSSDGLHSMMLGKATARGWGSGANWSSLNQLVQHESGWNPNAQNPTSTAYGLFQFLNSTWGSVGGHKTSDPGLQADYGLKYIAQRYGNPAKAWSFWNSHTPHWYSDGAVFNKASQIGIGENGPEAVMPLNDKGVNFIFDLMKRNSTEAQRSMLATGSSVQRASTVAYYSRVDKNTIISGPVTVKANNPNEFFAAMEQKKKMEALKGRH